MYAKHLSFQVGSVNIYGSNFYQVVLLPCITIPNYGDVVFSLWITSTYLSGYAKLCRGWIDEESLD